MSKPKPLLVAQCKGHIVLIVMPGEPAPISDGKPLAGRKPEDGGIGPGEVLDGDRFRPPNGAGRDWIAPSVKCSEGRHPAGHRLNGSKLRDAIDQLCRPGHTKYVDIGSVADLEVALEN